MINLLKTWYMFVVFFFKKRKIYNEFKKTENVQIMIDAAIEFRDFTLKKYDIKVNVEGQTNYENEQVLYVANHRSMYDPLYVFKEINQPCGFFIASEFKRFLKIPVMGKMINASRSIYINRNDGRETAKEIKRANEFIKQGEISYFVFPEGEIKSENETFNGKIGDFLPGSFKIALTNNLKIVPITIINSELCHCSNKYYEKVQPGIVDIYFHPAIEPSEYEGMNTTDICQVVKEIIISKLF